METAINPTAGQPAAVTVRGCAPGENVVVGLQGGTSQTVVCDASSVASASVAVPGSAGNYTGTANLDTSGVVLTFVPGVSATNTGLAFTGTDVNYPIYLAFGSVIIGAALLLAARNRNHQDATA